MSDRDRIKFDFLVEAIHDTREWIQFMDAKAGALALFLTSISFVLTKEIIQKISFIKDYLSQFRGRDIIYGILVFLLICFPIAILFIIFWILSPQINPKHHVKNNGQKVLNLFFLSRIDNDNKLEKSLDDYVTDLCGASKKNIITDLSNELLKLSYIRTHKETLMKIATWLVFSDIVFLLILFFIIMTLVKKL